MGDRKHRSWCRAITMIGGVCDCAPLPGTTPPEPPASPFPPELVDKLAVKLFDEVALLDDSRATARLCLSVVAEWLRSDDADERGAAELFRRTGIALVPGDMRAVLAAALEGKER